MARMQPLIEGLLKLRPKGRTLAELAAELGAPQADVAKLLTKTRLPGGSQLASWIGARGMTFYQVLPRETAERALPEREFRFLQHPTDSYLRVFIPDDLLDATGKPAKFVEIRPFSDVHWGHRKCDKKHFLLDVKEIERVPNRFSYLNGDIAENALGDSAGGAAWAEQDMNPDKQRTQLEEIFHRIRHKLFFALPGNHEDRTEKKTLMNPLREVARGLRIPYFSGPVNMEVVWRGYSWSFYCSHGTGASNTPGGKLNSAGKPRNYNDFRHFIVSGHVHDEMTHKVQRIMRYREHDSDGNLVRFWKAPRKEYKVILPAYLLYGETYAEKAGYSPGSRNTITMQLFANGDYHVVSSKRRNGHGSHDEII